MKPNDIIVNQSKIDIRRSTYISLEKWLAEIDTAFLYCSELEKNYVTPKTLPAGLPAQFGLMVS